MTITAAFQLVWMYTLEVLPTEFRSVVVGEGSVFGRVGSMFSPYIVDLLVSGPGSSPAARPHVAERCRFVFKNGGGGKMVNVAGFLDGLWRSQCAL